MGERKHPPFQWLVDTAMGEAQPEIEQAVERHLAVCEECRADYQWLQETLALMQSDFSVEPPAAATERAKAIFRRENKVVSTPGFWERMTSWFRFPKVLPAAATAAALLLVVVLSLVLPRQRSFAAVLIDGSAQMLTPSGTWETLHPGDDVPVGAVVRVGENVPAVLRFPDGSQVHVGKGGTLVLKKIDKSRSGWKIVTKVDSGSLNAMPVDRATMEVETPSGRCVTLAPGEYSVEVSSMGKTRVKVTVGELALSYGEKTLSLSDGEEITLPPIVQETPTELPSPPAFLPTLPAVKTELIATPTPLPSMPTGAHSTPMPTPTNSSHAGTPCPTPPRAQESTTPWPTRTSSEHHIPFPTLTLPYVGTPYPTSSWQVTPTPWPTRTHHQSRTPRPTVTLPPIPSATTSWGWWSTPTPEPTHERATRTPHPGEPSTPTAAPEPTETPSWEWSTPTPKPTHERVTETPPPTASSTPTNPPEPTETPSWEWSTPTPEPTHERATRTPFPTVPPTPTFAPTPTATTSWGWSTPTPKPTHEHATPTLPPTVPPPTATPMPTVTPPRGGSTPTPHPH